MSVLDKWLSKYAHNGEVATFATTATKRNTTHPVNGLVVANRWRQSGDIPDFPRIVAALSPADGDRKLQGNHVFAPNVAVVANVATPKFRPSAIVINYAESSATIVCIVCRRDITDMITDPSVAGRRAVLSRLRRGRASVCPQRSKWLRLWSRADDDRRRAGTCVAEMLCPSRAGRATSSGRTR